MNPSTGEVFATMPVSGPADVDARLRRGAASAFEGWRDDHAVGAEPGPVPHRRRHRGARRGARRRRVREHRASPRPLTMSEEIPPMVDQIRFFAGACRLLEGRSAGEYMTGFTSFVRREPVGVCAQVTPWNYPMMMAVWKFAPAIAAGNTVVLKPAQTTPVSTLLLAEIAAEFVPPGVFNVVCGDRDTGRALVAHPVPADGVDHRQRAGRARGGHRRRPGHQAGPPRARRQGPGRGLRRRRRREGGRGHRHRRLLQRRPGLHRRHPGAGRTAHPRRPRRRPGRTGPGPDRGRARRRGRRLRPAQQRRPAGPGAGLHRRPARPRHGAHRWPPDRRPRASSTSPRW